ncbi:MAG: methyl-accepting chemotaxis protein, partial [Planctomycetota bacterium]
ELEEVKQFLNRIDRRKGSSSSIRESVPVKVRLERVLDGYGAQVDANVRQVISCGREIQRSVEEIVSGSENQSDLVGRTTSIVEEMSTRVLSICDTADTALNASSDVRNHIESGLAEVKTLIDEMKQIRNHASARERKLQTLGEHTREIESIVESIGSLSSRTDLLALNASIESVRAGEHGRGFAIVADEVRALAEQSAEAVQDISRRIETIRLETGKSISVASGEHNQMNDVIHRMSETMTSLETLLDSAEQSRGGLDTIAQETGRQLKLTHDMVTALEQSSETSQHNRSRAEGAHWTSKSLAEVAEKLNSSLSLFRRQGNESITS